VTPELLLDLITRQMLSPTNDGVAQHRPMQVIFVNSAHAASLATTLASFGVRCGVLHEPPGLAPYVSVFSKQLVKAGTAADGAAPTRPGTLALCNSTRTGSAVHQLPLP